MLSLTTVHLSLKLQKMRMRHRLMTARIYKLRLSKMVKSACDYSRRSNDLRTLKRTIKVSLELDNELPLKLSPRAQFKKTTTMEQLKTKIFPFPTSATMVQTTSSRMPSNRDSGKKEAALVSGTANQLLVLVNERIKRNKLRSSMH